jgi:perosamine synthetase
MTDAEAPLQLARADLGARERELVLEVLDSNILALGPMQRRFEDAFAAFCGTRHAVAVSSGTAGLHLAARVAGIKPGDEVITSPISFVASANAVLYQGAVPVFADVDERTFNLDPDAVEALVTPRTKAILPVHIFGYPCALEPLQAIAGRHGLAIVEDACEALGATHGGRRLAGFGNPAVFGFYPNKQMTTGEGGMVTTDDDDFAAHVRALANQGRSDAGDWLEHDRLGFNYRMDELSAAVGLAQTERLPQLLADRAAVAARYGELLADLPGVELPCPDTGSDVRSWFVYVIRLAPEIDRTALMEHLRRQGVPCKPYLPAIHLQPFYRELGHGPGELPIAEAIAATTVAIPFYGTMTSAQQERVAGALRTALTAA